MLWLRFCYIQSVGRFPHMRGDVPGFLVRIKAPQIVFPTCVGMYRHARPHSTAASPFSPHAWGCTGTTRQLRPRKRFPHMRGDVPWCSQWKEIQESFSPHAWGCTDRSIINQERERVFPTCVGMYRSDPHVPILRKGFPHMRGDVPLSILKFGILTRFSPHAWGCTGNTSLQGCAMEVFPTCVGMYRRSRQ